MTKKALIESCLGLSSMDEDQLGALVDFITALEKMGAGKAERVCRFISDRYPIYISGKDVMTLFPQ